VHAKPETRNPKPETRNPKPETRNPKPAPQPANTGVYYRLAASGAICAAIGHGLLVPLDTVKTRMQTVRKRI